MQSQRTGPERPKKSRIRGWVVLAGLVIASGLYWQARPDAPKTDASKSQDSGKAAQVAAAVRTGRAVSGTVERTIRLTGTTSPERFAALVAPQLRGFRGLRGGGGGGRGVSRSSSGGGGGGGGGGGSSSSSSSSSSRSSSSSSGGMASALSRFSTPRSASSGGSSSSSVTAGMGIGSGGGTRISSGSQGFGGDDFSLTLEKLIPAGKYVKKGEVIAEFDRLNMLQRVDDLRDDFEQMDADLEKLRASQETDIKAEHLSLEKAKAALEKARLDLKTVPVKGAIDAERLRLSEEQALANYKQLLAAARLNEIVRKSALRMNEIDRQREKIELQQAEANADRMVIRTPIDGIAVMGTTRRGTDQVQIQAGDELRPGEIFVRIVDQSSMVVKATVNQSDLQLLRVGYKARIRFDAYPDLELPGHIYALAAMANPGGYRAQFVRQVPVAIKFDKLDPRVIPDLSVSVDIVLGSEPNTTVAPLGAVFYDAPDQPYVMVRKQDGWERRAVQLGVSNNIHVAVRSGLKPGEVVALERPPQAAKGQQRRPG